jgi:hypothetical protein
MDKQLDYIKGFCMDAKFFMVKYPSEGKEEFGKILKGEDIVNIDLSRHEVHRSIEYKNGNLLFVLDLKPKVEMQRIDNPLQLLLKNLEEARAIETVYPKIFKWVFDGLSIKAYAIVPSGDVNANSTITRYGGADNFIKILRKHLKNIGKMSVGQSPDFNFLDLDEKINDTEISIGSINMFNKMYSVVIDPNMSYTQVVKNSLENVHVESLLNILFMKYWAKEINPDFISEAKHIKLANALPNMDNAYDLYPPCVKAMMAMKNKGNRTRFLIARFLLSAHKANDAKFIYMSILTDEEREHIKSGNCSSQWNYILNNIQRYSAPTCRELREFCSQCGLVHPLEKIQEKLMANKENEDE